MEVLLLLRMKGASRGVSFKRRIRGDKLLSRFDPRVGAVLIASTDIAFRWVVKE